MFRYLSIILKNSRRNRRRSVLTVLSIGVSMCLLGMMIGMYYAFYFSDPTPEQALRLVTRNRVSLTFQMPQAYRERIRQVPGVREIVISQWYGGVYKDSRDPNNFFARFATEPDRLFTVYPELQIPEDQKKAFQRERTACLIGRDLANKHHFQLGDRIPLTGDIFPGKLDLTVRGIFDIPRKSEILYFHREYLEESLAVARRGNAGTFTILVDSPEIVPRVGTAIDQMFHNSTVETKTESEQAFALSFVSFLGNVKVFLLSISAAIVFTVLLVSANTMAMSVRERVREVGVLKTLGFTRGGILGIILGEACTISLAGGGIGFLLSMLLMRSASNSPFGGFIPPLGSVTPVMALACVLTAVSVGLLSSLIPAWNASRTPIVEALRSTD